MNEVISKLNKSKLNSKLEIQNSKLPTRKRVGLALGSGGIRGLAHVGVIKVLLENKIPIDYIAGCSIGAWVGVHYGLYKDLAKLAEYTVGKKQEKLRSFFEPTLRGGLIKGEKLEVLFEEWLEHKTFADLQLPVKLVATDLVAGEPVVLDKGSLAHATRVSMAVTGAFSPIIEGKKILADGGVCNPVPDDLVRQMGADIVISVNLDDFKGQDRFSAKDISLVNVAARSIEIMRHHLAVYSLKNSDIVITPTVARFANWREYFWNDAGDDIVKEGEVAAEKEIENIKKLLAK